MVQRAVAVAARRLGTSDVDGLARLLDNALAWIDAHPGSLAICMTAHGVISNALSQVSSSEGTVAALGRGIAAALNPEKRPAFLHVYTEWSKEAAPVWGSLPGAVHPLERLQPPGAATPFALPEGVVDTEALRMHFAVVVPWLQVGEPFVLCGPRGSGKSTVLLAAAATMPGVQTAELACSSQTVSEHVEQKLLQVLSPSTWFSADARSREEVARLEISRLQVLATQARVAPAQQAIAIIAVLHDLHQNTWEACRSVASQCLLGRAKS
jgi:hypothetical protein